MKILKKIIKYLSITVLVIFLVINAIIIFSGRWYLYKAVYTTYLSGKTGANATEYQIFENNKVNNIEKTPQPQNFNYSKLVMHIYIFHSLQNRNKRK